MRKAQICMHGIKAGILYELANKTYEFHYDNDYAGEPISLTMPIIKKTYVFNQFPSAFEGLLPEGSALEALLKKYKLDEDDYFAQLLQIGSDVVGAMTIEEIK